MVTKFGTLFARADFENENQNHNDLRTKNDRRDFYLPTGATFIQGARKAVFRACSE